MNLTWEQILTLEEGARLDRLIAEEIMGWHENQGRKEWFNSDSKYTGYVVQGPVKYPKDTFNPSTDIYDAWRIVEKLGNSSLQCCAGGSKILWYVSFSFGREATAKEAPLAICRAALLAKLK